MKIAFVSFEYPPHTAYGGIATYVKQIAVLLSKRGHYVEVFSFHPTTASFEDEGDGILVTRITGGDKYSFKQNIVSVFAERHHKIGFEILESPEFMADGLEIKKQFPQLPLVVKLHTPDFLVKEISGLYPEIPDWRLRFRWYFGAYRHFRKPKPYWWTYIKEDDPEYQIVSIAELVSTPSVSLGKIVSKKWRLNHQIIKHIPYPFIPNASFLNIPIKSSSNLESIVTIGYIGRLEIRKGVAIFTKVIPTICQQFKKVRFVFIGKDEDSPIKGVSMKQHILEQIGQYASNVEFINQVRPEEIPGVLANIDICVFPSIWENFPNVCLEAMSAGRAIVASKKGGMKDMLHKPTAGLLINPLSAKSIVSAISKLVRNLDLRVQLGTAARKSVLEKYNETSIAQMVEKHYQDLV